MGCVASLDVIDLGEDKELSEYLHEDDIRLVQMSWELYYKTILEKLGTSYLGGIKCIFLHCKYKGSGKETFFFTP